MGKKLILFLKALADHNQFEAELRSEIDGSGFFALSVNFINPIFTQLLEDFGIKLFNVHSMSVGKKLLVDLKFL